MHFFGTVLALTAAMAILSPVVAQNSTIVAEKPEEDAFGQLPVGSSNYPLRIRSLYWFKNPPFTACGGFFTTECNAIVRVPHCGLPRDVYEHAGLHKYIYIW